MLKFVLMLAIGLAVGLISAGAEAHWRHPSHHHWRSHSSDVVVLHRGYGRKGPPSGYRFGFVTYRGDPFARDDYYDRGSCYYLHRRDFCLDFRKPWGLPH
jgi:hypothetical protein